MAKNVGGSNPLTPHKNMNRLSLFAHLSALAASIEWYHLDRGGETI